MTKLLVLQQTKRAARIDTRPALWALGLTLCLTAGLFLSTPDATAAEKLLKLTASDPGPAAHFGTSVAVSGDTAVIGAPNAYAHPGPGSAYVFTRVGDTWVEQAKLTASDAALGDHFGFGVAISGDTIVVSAFWDDVGGYVDQGSAYVFTRREGRWTEQAKLTASDGGPLDAFGFSVAMFGDDVIVGAKSVGEQFLVPPEGAAYVFSRRGETWVQKAKLTPSDGHVGNGFGFRVGIDGDTAVVGAVTDNDGQGLPFDGKGAAYVFNRTGGTWTQEKKLTASDGLANDEFGFWVAVSGDTVVVGDPSDNGHGTASVFTRAGGSWPLQKILTGSNAAKDDTFGRSVAVSGDTVVVGAQGKAAYVFKRTGADWNEKAILTAADSLLFGVSVGISGDTALVGAAMTTVGTNFQAGAAYVWRDPTASMPSAAIDIKPGDNANRIRTSSNDEIAVAVLTDATFDASSVDPSTVCFGDEPPHGGTAAYTQPSGVDADCSESHLKGHTEDSDGDGDLDMILHFNTAQTGIDAGDTEAHLTGKTAGGVAFRGSDSIQTTGHREQTNGSRAGSQESQPSHPGSQSADTDETPPPLGIRPLGVEAESIVDAKTLGENNFLAMSRLGALLLVAVVLVSLGLKKRSEGKAT